MAWRVVGLERVVGCDTIFGSSKELDELKDEE